MKGSLIKFAGASQAVAAILSNNLRAAWCQSFVRHGSGYAALKERLEQELNGIRAAGTWKTERVITSKQDVSINVEGSQGNLLNFCANNYLGLSVSTMNQPN